MRAGDLLLKNIVYGLDCQSLYKNIWIGAFMLMVCIIDNFPIQSTHKSIHELNTSLLGEH